VPGLPAWAAAPLWRQLTAPTHRWDKRTEPAIVAGHLARRFLAGATVVHRSEARVELYGTPIPLSGEGGSVQVFPVLTLGRDAEVTRVELRLGPERC
jgi:hypothetical protein